MKTVNILRTATARLCAAKPTPPSAHKGRTLVTLLMMLLTTATAWAQDEISGLTYNTEGGYYEISDAQDLVDLATYVNGGNNASGKTFKQTADITLTEAIAQIGNSGNKLFMGTYDGGDHSISGLVISTNTTYVGLFGRVDAGTVKNLRLISPSITNTTSRSGNSSGPLYVGGIAGQIDNRGKIDNCHVISPTFSFPNVANPGDGGLHYGAILGAYGYRKDRVTGCYYYSDTYGCMGVDENGNNILQNCARVYRLTLGSDVTATADLTIGTATYCKEGSTVTLGHADRDGYIFGGYTVNGSAIDGNTFSITADATVAATFTPDPAHFSVNAAGTEYTIHTATGWGVFCDALQDNSAYNRFSGKTVKLDENIGTAQDPITRMAGCDGHEFMGNFDGGGNTLTFTVTTATDNYCAPFRNVKGGSTADAATTISNLNVVTTITATDYRHMAGLIALQSGHVNVTGINATVDISSSKGSNNPTDLYPAALVSQAGSGGTLTVSGCTATGTISTDGKYAAGLVGIVQGAASISDCVSSVTINSSTSGDGTHAGIVAVVNGAATIDGCLFSGKLLTVNTGETATTNCAGFIAWGNGAISNSLYAPANIGDGETEVLTGNVDYYPSGTFYRGTAPTVFNCYYTRKLGTAQGKAPRTVTAGENVTIEAISPVGSPVENGTYSVSGITAYAKGITRTVGQTTTFYYGNEDQVSLTLSNTATGAPLGYQYGYTASNGGTLSGNATDSWTLTMPDENVTISVALRSTREPVTVSYIDENGETQTVDAIALDGYEDAYNNIITISGWKFVGKDINYGDKRLDNGNYDVMSLILGDGTTMTLSGDNAGVLGNQQINIYGQAGGTGRLNINSSSDYTPAIMAENITLCGGHISATGVNAGIQGENVTLAGATVTVTATNGNAYYVGGTFSIAPGLAYTDGQGHSYSGTLYDASNTANGQFASLDALNTALAGQTLSPNGYALTANEADGNRWTTFYSSKSGFSIETADAFAYTAEYDNANSQLTLHKLGSDIPAGTAVVIASATSPVTLAINGKLGEYSGDNDLKGEDVRTSLDDIKTTRGDGTFYVMGKKVVNEQPLFGFFEYTASHMPARKAYLLIDGGAALANGLKMVFDDETTSLTPTPSPKGEGSDYWYTLSGTRLSAQPTQPGLYINNGKKVVVK